MSTVYRILKYTYVKFIVIITIILTDDAREVRKYIFNIFAKCIEIKRYVQNGHTRGNDLYPCVQLMCINAV